MKKIQGHPNALKPYKIEFIDSPKYNMIYCQILV